MGGTLVKAIITGATGGLGRNLGEFLQEKGWELLGFGQNREIGEKLGFPFKAFDLSNEEACLDAFETCDVVFHCAALSKPWGSYALFHKNNVQATQNVLTAMQKHNIPKLVHVSTPSIYFDFTDQLNVKEEHLASVFVNAYAKTKHEAETLVLASSIDTTIIRPRGIFGEYDTVLVPRLEKIAKKGFLPLLKNKNALIDVTYVGNVVHAMHLASTKPLPKNSIFNITNDEPIEVNHLFKLVMESLKKDVKYKEIKYSTLMRIASLLEFISKLGFGKEPALTKYGVGLISYDQTLDIQKAKEILGYKPLYSIKEGLERYAKSRN